jgi:hypothetical protein
MDFSLRQALALVGNAELRSQLEQFEGRDPKKSWAWYVQGTGKVTKSDFGILTVGQNRAKKAKA